MVFSSEELGQDLAKRLDQMINAVPEMPVLPYPNPQCAKRKEIISRIITNRPIVGSFKKHSQTRIKIQITGTPEHV